MEEASSCIPEIELTECENLADIEATPKEKSPLEEKEKKPLNMSPGAVKLRSWLNKMMRIEMSDGRVLVGVFLCTDRDANVILTTCSEYIPEDEAEGGSSNDEPRMLGLVMVPGKHIVSVSIEKTAPGMSDLATPLSEDVSVDDVT